MKEKLKNKKVVYTIIGVISLLLVVIAITYAYWLITKNQTGENLITSACLDISLTNEENDIKLTNQFPLSDEDGAKLTPYTFTVTNNCNTSVDYHINLESIGTESETVIPSAIKAMLDENTPQVLSDYSEKDITVEGAYEAHLLGAGTLSAKDTEGSSANHSLRLWIDEDAPISEMNKTFRSKISVTIGQGITNFKNPYNEETLAYNIIQHARNNVYFYDEVPDFEQTTTDGEFGLYHAEDDYGTSYYFRGDVENNYVKFGTWSESAATYYSDSPSTNATYYTDLNECENDISDWVDMGAKCFKVGITQGDPMYWRIVRINGDGTVKLVMENIIEDMAEVPDYYISHNLLPSYEDFGLSCSYGNEYYCNETLESWYNKHLYNNYNSYIVDSIFCNDREVHYSATNELDGIVYEQIEYKGWHRINNYDPNLSCNREEDEFTVENKKLNFPIGLLTADEIMMAGAITNENSACTNYFLYSGGPALAMTASIYNDAYFGEFGFGTNQNGILITTPENASARPVINLKSDVQFMGAGTKDNPYVIVTN